MTPRGWLPGSPVPGDTARDVYGWVWTAVVREKGSKQRRWVREGDDTRARSANWLLREGLFTNRLTPA